MDGHDAFTHPEITLKSSLRRPRMAQTQVYGLEICARVHGRMARLHGRGLRALQGCAAQKASYHAPRVRII